LPTAAIGLGRRSRSNELGRTGFQRLMSVEVTIDSGKAANNLGLRRTSTCNARYIESARLMEWKFTWLAINQQRFFAPVATARKSIVSAKSWAE
jgi:hypothetical protein